MNVLAAPRSRSVVLDPLQAFRGGGVEISGCLGLEGDDDAAAVAERKCMMIASSNRRIVTYRSPNGNARASAAEDSGCNLVSIRSIWLCNQLFADILPEV
jgi:hypothetical protein